jgi:hypothetical protein
MIFYRDHKNKKLENIAADRMHASDASIREKIDAALVKVGMKSKRILGMGVNYWFCVGSLPTQI